MGAKVGFTVVGAIKKKNAIEYIRKNENSAICNNPKGPKRLHIKARFSALHTYKLEID